MREIGKFCRRDKFYRSSLYLRTISKTEISVIFLCCGFKYAYLTHLKHIWSRNMTLKFSSNLFDISNFRYILQRMTIIVKWHTDAYSLLNLTPKSLAGGIGNCKPQRQGPIVTVVSILYIPENESIHNRTAHNCHPLLYTSFGEINQITFIIICFSKITLKTYVICFERVNER